MGVHGQLDRQLAAAQHLDRVLQRAHDAGLLQQLRGDLGAGVEPRPGSRTFTGVVCVRNGPIGIDFLWFGPRSLPSRMYSGICPPSKPGRMLWLPDRDFWPFWPRPAVLPLPEPWPRPTRLRSRWLPSAGFSVCSGGSVHSSVLDLHS